MSLVWSRLICTCFDRIKNAGNVFSLCLDVVPLREYVCVVNVKESGVNKRQIFIRGTKMLEIALASVVVVMVLVSSIILLTSIFANLFDSRGVIVHNMKRVSSRVVAYKLYLTSNV